VTIGMALLAAAPAAASPAGTTAHLAVVGPPAADDPGPTDPGAPVGAGEAVYGVPDAAPAASDPCISITGAVACFTKYGDKIRVKKNAGGGGYAAAVWSNYLWSGSWHWYRSGVCVNNHPVGTWAVCNYNFYEDTTYHAYGNYGSGIRLAASNYWSTSNDLWIRNDG